MNKKEEITLSKEKLPKDTDDVLDDSKGAFLGEDVEEQELPDYDPDVTFEGDDDADN